MLGLYVRSWMLRFFQYPDLSMLCIFRRVLWADSMHVHANYMFTKTARYHLLKKNVGKRRLEKRLETMSDIRKCPIRGEGGLVLVTFPPWDMKREPF